MMSIWSEIWSGIVAGLNFLLQAFYRFSGSYGIAIILLTLLVKLVLLPLTIKQTRSMVAMQKIQPEIRKLQEKYKDDKEKLSQEMMKFYKENKINPLGGCFPLLLQMPIFFALFTVLRKYLLTPPTVIMGNALAVFRALPWFQGGLADAYASIPAIKSSGFLWMGNLADTTRIADPYFILIILLAASTWYSQKQVMSDPRQKNMLIIMPLITAFIGLSLPAGVVLYWLTTNILQILQQLGMEVYDKRFSKEQPKVLPAKAQEANKQKGATKAGPATVPPKGKPKAGQYAEKKGVSQKAKKKPTSGGKQKPGGSQVRRPKGPPPQQKSGSKGAAKGGKSKQGK